VSPKGGAVSCHPWDTNGLVSWLDMSRKFDTLGSLVAKHGSRQEAFRKVRALARRWHKPLLDQPCQNCGYAKHVELCHIRGIASFSPETPLLVVNGSHNLVVLCPNCHTEHDAGELQVEDFLDI
jgi:5-methylcytosine-specific restriction endonuclease McrA